MATTPKYDNDYVTLGYLNKTLGAESEETKTEINKIPKNYNSPPVPPYYENSLLLLNGQIYKCIKSRLVGSFNISDWKIVVSTNELDEALRFIYDVNKLEYVDQEDGVIETFYQEEDPSLNWETDIEKNKHVSDLWTIDNSICYQYEKKATNPVTYGWKRVSIPTSLFDIVDGYRKIFTEEPTNYSKDDLWLGEITKIAIESSETFDSSHWEDRDDFIESSITEQEEYHKVYLLPKITEINRQTQSEIRKAVDEIVLRVSQTYTTKTEVEQYIDDVKTGVAEEYTTKEEFNAQLSLTSTQINAIVEKNTQQDGNIETLNQEYASLKITSDGIKTQVSSIESEIESTNENVNSLQTEIQGVNANFNEFKDNEYINSINNLQNQIDGAIQFWNGPEIPTIENYPANEWITENEKINHQADIYTVIQDVEGEMKQGKSYRFDKINSVWQWIELTDNELSAVQAIAQDALNKSNQNTTDIQSLNKKTSELEQTDSEIKASVTTLNNKYEKDTTLTKQASGNPITIEDAGAYPCENFIVEGKSEQEVTTQKAGDNIFDFKVWHNKISSGDMTISYGKNCGFILNENGFSTRNVPTGIDSWISINAKVNGELVGWSYTSTGISDAKKQVAKQFTLPAKASTEYTLSCDVSFDTTLTGTAMKTELYAFLYDENFEYLGLRNLQIKNEFEANVPQRLSLTFSTNATTKYIFWRVDNESFDETPANMTVANVAIKEGKDTTYTEYVPNSPSPDYPSEIKTVKGIENLFSYGNSNISGTKNGITYNYDKDTQIWTLDGTATGQADIPFVPPKILTLSKYIYYRQTQFYLEGSISNGKVTTYSQDSINGWKGINISLTDNMSYSSLLYYSIDLDLDASYLVRVSKGTVLSNFKFKTQLVRSAEEFPYIPYGDKKLINKINSKNIANLSNLNILVKGLNVVSDDDGKLSISGTATGTYGTIKTITYDKPKFKKGDKVSFSWGLTKELKRDTIGNPYVWFLNKNMTTVNSIAKIADKTTISEDIYRIMIGIENYVVGTTYDEEMYVELEKSSIIPTKYEPYKEKIITYDLKKENLFDSDIELGSWHSGSGLPNDVTNAIRNANIILVEPNTTYTIKNDKDYNFFVQCFDESENYLSSYSGYTNKYIFTTPPEIKFIKVATYLSDNITDVDVKFSLYKGTGTDDYYELVSIDDIKDELNEVSGKLTEKIGKYVITGNENITYDTSNDRFIVTGVTPQQSDKRHPTISNYFCYNATSKENGIAFVYYKSIYLYDRRFKDVDSYKAHLQELYNAGIPVEIYYILDEPQTIQLEPTEIELFKGTNNIYTLDDLEPNMNITYLTDTKMNAQYATKSELKVAEGNIKSEINATLENEYTTIEQTNAIEQKITDAENSIMLKVNETSKSVEELEKTTEASLELKLDKTDNDKVVSMLNASAEEINLKANRFSMESDKSRIDKDGTVKFEGGTVGGFEITKDKLSTQVSQTYGPFTDSDLQTVQQVISGQIGVTQELLDKYDIDGNGILDISDLLSIQRIILGTDSGEHNGTIAINSNNYSHPFETYSNGILHNKIGVEGAYFKKIGGNKVTLVNDETGEAQIRIEDRTNNKTCVIKATTDIREMDSGICNLNSTDVLFIPFNKTFEYVPNVVITPYTTTTGVIAPKVRSISNTGFEATIGGSGFSNVQCCWIAIG